MKKCFLLVYFFLFNFCIKLFAQDVVNSDTAKIIRKAVDKVGSEIDGLNRVGDFSNGGTSIHQSLYALVGLVFIWQMASIVIKNLLEPEVFSFAKLKKPLLLFGVLTCFYSIDYLVRDIISPAINEYVEDSQKQLVKINEEKIQSLDEMQNQLDKLRANKERTRVYSNSKYQKSVEYTLDDKGKPVFNEEKIWTYDNKKKAATDEGVSEFLSYASKDLEDDSSWLSLDTLEEIAIRIKYLDEFIMFQVFNWFMKFIYGIDALLLSAFYLVQWVWLRVLAMGAPIALVISAFSGGWSNLITWAKTYVSTSLWYFVAVYCVNLVNYVQVAVSKNVIKSVQDYSDKMVGDLSFAANLSQLGGVIIILIITGLLFLCVKIILIGKVPAMIASFISGGNASAEGFSSGFAPISAVRGAASVGFAAATGGASSVAQVGSGLIKGGK